MTARAEQRVPKSPRQGHKEGNTGAIGGRGVGRLAASGGKKGALATADAGPPWSSFPKKAPKDSIEPHFVAPAGAEEVGALSRAA